MGLTVLSIEVSAGEVLGHPFGPRLCNTSDFYHYVLMHPQNNFYTPLRGPRTSVSNQAPDLLTPALHSSLIS